VNREAYLVMMKIKNFRDLAVWQLGKEIVLQAYRVTKGFPREELYGLVSQMRRAAVSIPSNVAEGLNRKHNPEFRQALYVILGSCAELETYVELAYELGFMTVRDRAQMIEGLDHESRMLRNLLKHL